MEKDITIAKKAYDASIRWCADGLDPYDLNGGFVINCMLGYYNEVSSKDMPDLAQMTILLKSVQEAIKAHRLAIGTAIMAGGYK